MFSTFAFWNFIQMILLIPMLDLKFDSIVAAFIARFKFVLFVFNSSDCKFRFFWLNLACKYNINNIDVDNTVIHYGWLIGLEDGNPFKNISNLVFILVFSCLTSIAIYIILYSWFWCKVFKVVSQNNENQNSNTLVNFKWYKIYAAFRFSFYIRVMIQILMTVVLISHPLCKQLLVLL